MATPKKINSVHADVFAELDSEVESNSSYVGARMKELLENVQERNIPLWKSVGVDVELFDVTLSQIEQASAGIHDLTYTLNVAGLWGAVRLQVLVEMMKKGILKTIDGQSKKLNKIASSSDKEELKQAAKDGTQKAEFLAAKDRRNGTTGKQ